MNELEKILEEIEEYEACEYGWNEAIEAVIEVL